MSAHLSAEFLADYFEVGAFNSGDVQHVGDESGIRLDGKTRRQIDSEMLVGNQHNAVGRQNLLQGFADQFGIGIGKSLVGNLPDLRVGSAEGVARGIEVRAPTGENGGRRSSGIDLARSGREFERGIGGHATFMCDVSEDASHYFNPPLAVTNSRTLSTFSSRLPCRISAPLPSAGTK